MSAIAATTIPTQMICIPPILFVGLVDVVVVGVEGGLVRERKVVYLTRSVMTRTGLAREKYFRCKVCSFYPLPSSLSSLLSTHIYTTMTSLSQRLLHTSLPHRLLASKAAVRCISTNPTPSEMALQARNLIRDASNENVAEPTRKFEVNQVSHPLQPINHANIRSTHLTSFTNHHSIPKEAPTLVNPS
jgi:hypothetical protein